MIEKYKKAQTKFKIQCPKKHKKYISTYDNFILRGRRCKQCKINDRKTTLKLPIKDAKEIAKSANLILISTDYDNMKSHVELKCIECNYEFSSTLDSIKNKHTGCQNCKSSYGERKILQYLEQLVFTRVISSFQKEFRFIKGECDLKRPLPFDFMFKLKNCIALIEFDGIQHFDNTVEFKAGINNFNHTRKSDLIKTRYCYFNDIPLLRISYKDIEIVDKLIIEFILSINRFNKGVKDSNIIMFSDTAIYKELMDEL